MSRILKVPDRTLKQQEAVSDPSVSAWVTANAGAGKTTVLVRRVIRLLLDGNPPARILCLTFTKAAAANMANKVLDTLSKWVRLDDAALDEAIRRVSPLEPTPALRATARRLFAQALETPGGLKVQTIHAFCDRVLHQFPFEAGVQASFEVLDDVREADLLERARHGVLIEASEKPDGELGRALAQAVTVASDKALEEALDECVRERRKLARLREAGSADAVAGALGVAPAETSAAIEQAIVDGPHLPRSEWKAAGDTLAGLGGNAAKCGAKFASAADIDAYLAIFFTQEGEPRADSGFGAAKARADEPDLFNRIFAERDRLVALRDRLFAVRALERTRALLALAFATIDRFESSKRALGALDYADLIDKTSAMFRDTGAGWVLYKLDGGIDHVLIDEAQDTSPEQWEIVARLTADFFAGKGARESKVRTIFAVGDEKQSIFSFQGADPREFERMRREFERRVREAERRFVPEKLDLSFRSVKGVLEAVDAVFARPEAFRGLTSGDEKKTIHGAIRDKAPALVELWDTEKPGEEDETAEPWDAPLNATSEASPVVRLAEKIGAAVRHWLDGGLAIADRDTDTLRAPRAGDVIVLVRRRGPLFEAILQSLKRAGVEVAGADRLVLSEHIAVMDLMALGDALLFEQDELALASVLKSPLFGLDEDQLYQLAHGRSGTLAAALLAPSADSAIAAAAEQFGRWRAEAAALRPFDFYSRVLGRDRGRAKMLARLGPEAADALDEFLARALAYEQTDTPSLPGFLSFLRRAGTEVKRDLEVESDAVRVMTVHGAKGLEAPVIVLADTLSMPDGWHDAKLLAMPGGDALVWGTSKDEDPSSLRAARDDGAEQRAAEYRRLLYVALTRAADALVVCGYETSKQSKSGPPEGCWYQLVREALKDELVEGPAPGFPGTVWRWRPQDVDAPARAEQPPAKEAKLPEWLGESVPLAAPAASAPRDTEDESETSEDRRSVFAAFSGPALDPLVRGDLLHRLLHRLPDVAPGQRRERALEFLAGVAAGIDPSTRERLADEALGVLDLPELAPLFAPGSRGEVEVIAHLESGEMRRIDRLAVSDESVIVADFKSGTPPAPGEAIRGNYLSQLAVYRDVLREIYPKRAMRCLLVWTESGTVQEIAAEALDSASRPLFKAP